MAETKLPRYRKHQAEVLKKVGNEWCSDNEGPLLDVLAATECLECVQSHIRDHRREYGNGAHQFELGLSDVLTALHELISQMWAYNWAEYSRSEKEKLPNE